MKKQERKFNAYIHDYTITLMFFDLQLIDVETRRARGDGAPLVYNITMNVIFLHKICPDIPYGQKY